MRGPVAGSTTPDVLSLGATKNYISKALKCTHFYFTTGYSTHMIGKWHLGFCSWSYTPRYRGFDSFYGIYLGAGDHYTHETARILDLHDNETPVENKDGVYSTYLYAEVWNNNRFLFILFFFRLAISPTWSYEEKKCSTFCHKKNLLDLDCRLSYFFVTNVWELRKWNQVKNGPRSCERNLCNCVRVARKKFTTSTGFIPVT